MKIKNEFELEKLLEYGFEKVDKQQAIKDDEYAISRFDYVFIIGHSRRGQFYYLLVSEKTRDINIYASEPDGDGTFILLPNVLLKMINDGLLIN